MKSIQYTAYLFTLIALTLLATACESQHEEPCTTTCFKVESAEVIGESPSMYQLKIIGTNDCGLRLEAYSSFVWDIENADVWASRPEICTANFGVHWDFNVTQN